MNFGVNLYNWLLSNAQPLVLVAIVVIGGGILQQFLQFFKRFMADVRLQQKPVYSMVNGIVSHILWIILFEQIPHISDAQLG